jgi:hypothetical protein
MQFLDTLDFEKIELALSIQLPKHFKKFHLEQQNLITELQSHDDMYLEVDADNFIELNKIMALPKNKIIIGQDGCGNFYFIDISPNSVDETVYTIPHDDFEQEEIFDTVLNDYKWDNEKCQTGANLTEHINYFISMIKSCQ